MNKYVVFLFLLISVISCEKNKTETIDINTDFSTHILEGYWVKSITFDNLGNAWIGTYKQGLIKYNNDTTILYTNNNSPISDTANIWDITVDSKDNVWIGGDALIKFDGDDFSVYNSENTIIPEDFIYRIAVDSKDNVWFTACRMGQGGIVKYNGTDMVVYTPDNSDMPINYVKSISIDKNDNVWLALQEKVRNTYLIKITDNTWTVYDSTEIGFNPYWYGEIKNNSKNQICCAVDYSLLYTITNSGSQLFIFDGENTQQTQFDNTSEITDISIDNDDNIWCSGIYDDFESFFAVYNGKDWIVDYSFFRYLGIFDIEQSPNGNIWIGTGNGIYINN